MDPKKLPKLISYLVLEGTHLPARTESIYEFILMLNSGRCYQQSMFMMISIAFISMTEWNLKLLMTDFKNNLGDNPS